MQCKTLGGNLACFVHIVCRIFFFFLSFFCNRDMRWPRLPTTPSPTTLTVQRLSGEAVFRCRGAVACSLLNIHGGSLRPLHRPSFWVRTLRDEQVSVSESLAGMAESSPQPIRREMHTDFQSCSDDKKKKKQGARRWGETTPVSPSSSSGGGSSSGETAPPTGGSEVLQADEYIKGLLLWTVQSFSCCFNAACPVPSVEQVSYRILRPWMAQGPNWGEKHHTQSYSGGEGELTACSYLLVFF